METFACCGPYVYDEATVTPSGLTRASVPPALFSLNPVWSGWPEIARSLPDANTTRRLPPGNCMDGKVHLVRLVRLSVRCQPPRFTRTEPVLCSSIQSGEAWSA